MEIKKKKLHITNLAVITLLDGGKFVVLFVVVVVVFFYYIFIESFLFSLVCSHFDLSHLEQFFTRNRYNTKHIE